MNIELTMNLRGQECTVIAEILPPDSHAGVYGWHVETLTVIDAAGIELMLTEQEEEEINEKCNAAADEKGNWDDDWL